MADSERSIRVGNADQLAAAAKRALADSTRAAELTDEAAAKLEAERAKLDKATRQMERALEKSRGRGRNAASSEQTIARRRARIAEIDEELGIGRRAVDNTAKIERAKTAIVQQEVAKRVEVVEAGARAEEAVQRRFVVRKRGGGRSTYEVVDRQETRPNPHGREVYVNPARAHIAAAIGNETGTLPNQYDKEIERRARAQQREAKKLEQANRQAAQAAIAGEQQVTRAVEEGAQRRQLGRGGGGGARPPRVPPVRDLPPGGGAGLQRYIEQAQAAEAVEYSRRAKSLLSNSSEMLRQGRSFPPGYDLEAVLRRQAQVDTAGSGQVRFTNQPKGQLGLFADTQAPNVAAARQELINSGVALSKAVARIGSDLAKIPDLPRVTDESAASRKALAELERRNLFTPIGAEPPPKPKITYNPAFLREQEEMKAAAARAEARRASNLEAQRSAGRGQYAQPIGPERRPAPRAPTRLPQGYTIQPSGDPLAKHDLIGPGGRLVSSAATKKELYGTARGDVAEQAREVEAAERAKTKAVTEGAREREEIRVTEANRAAAAPTLAGLTSHLPEEGRPGIHREQGIDRRMYEATGQKLPRSDINLFTARDQAGRLIGALESFAPFLAKNAEGGTLERGGKPVWQATENAIAVDPAHQRQGIATSLLRKAIAENIELSGGDRETYTEAGAALANRMREIEAAGAGASGSRYTVHGPSSHADQKPYYIWEEREGQAGRLPPGTGNYATREAAERRIRKLEAAGGGGAKPPALPPAPAAPEDEPERREKAEERKTKAVQEGARARTEASSQEGRAISGDAAEFERIIEKNTAVARDAALLAQHRQYEAAAAAGEVPRIDTEEAARQAERERKIADAREKTVRTGQGVVPHPTLFGARQPGPFGQVFRAAGVSDEPSSAAYRARSPLAALEEQRRVAELAQRASAGDKRKAKTPDELRDAEETHRANLARTAALRAEIKTIEASIEERILSNRAQAEHTAAMAFATRQELERYRGGPPAGPPTGRGPQAQIGPGGAQRQLPPGVGYELDATGRVVPRRGDIIQHPTQFGARRPGPFGQVFGEEFTAHPTEIIDEDVFNRRANEAASSAAREAARRRVSGDIPLDPAAQARAEAAAARLKTNRDAVAASTARANAEEQRLARGLGISSDAMRRHGLLTTEFLSAMGAGRTTVRELGIQMGGTIAKFGGWTAAASLTYGGLAAISAVGKGAIDSANGVTDLRRVLSNVDTDQAQQQFRDLAQQFNLPVGDVTEAFFQSSKAFKSQGDAAKATAAQLFAMKIGELDVAASAQFTTAAVRGFNLSADDLGHVVDVVNILQNNFGANFKDTAQGIATAAGAFGAAGGNVEELASFVAEGALKTGRSGKEIATALRRTSEIVRRPERRARIIDLLGIDPQDHSITEVLEAGQRLLEKDPSKGLQIATTLSTPELASGRILPILQGKELYEGLKASAQDAGGSAERELGVALGSVGEQVKAITVDLSTLGSALGQSGLLDTFGALIVLLDKGLDLTTLLVEQFNLLPRPLRVASIAGAELLGTLALIRRFNPSAADEGGRVGFFQRRPQQHRRAQILQGLEDERAFLGPERTRAALQAARLNEQVTRQRTVATGLEPAVLAGTASEREIERYNRAAERLVVLEAAKADAEETAEELAERQRRVITQRSTFRRRTTRRAIGGGASQADIDRIAVQEGILYGSSYEPRPSPDRPTPTFIPGGGGRRPVTDAERAAAEEARRSTRETLRTAPGVAGYSTAAEAAAVSAQTDRRMKIMTGLTTASLRMQLSVKNAASGLKNLAAGIAASIGPFEGLILAGLGVYTAYKIVADGIKEDTARLDSVQAAIQINDPQKAQAAIAKRAKQRSTLDTWILGPASGLISVTPLADALGVKTPYQRQQEAEAAAAARASDLAAQVQASKTKGVGLTGKEIEARLKKNLADGMAPAEALAQANREASVNFGILTARTPAQLTKALGDIAKFKDNNKALVRQANAMHNGLLDALTATELIVANPNAIFSRGVTPKLLRANRHRIAELRTTLAGSVDEATSTEAIDSIGKLQDPIEAELQARQERQLRAARTPRQKRVVNRQYIDALREVRTKPIRDALEANAKRDADFRKQIDAAEADPRTGFDRPRAGGTEKLAAAHERIEKLRNAIKDNKKARGDLRGQLRREQANLKDLQRQQDQDNAAEERAVFDARTSLGAGQRPAGLGRIRYELGRAGEAIKQLAADHMKGTVEYINALAQQQDLMAQQAQEQVDLIGLRADYAAAGIADPTQAAAREQQGRRDQLAAQLADPQHFGAKQNLPLMTQIRAADKQRKEQERQDAIDLISARYEYLRSLTDNPIKLARLEEQEAQRLLDRGGFKNQAERYKALAQRNNARRAKETAITDRRLENLGYEHDIGKLTDDAWIHGMEKVLSTMKKGSEARRKLKMDIGRAKHEIQQEGDFNVNVGDIKLPTIYEIRRAVAGSKGGATVVQNNQVTLNAHGVNDPRALLAQVDNHLSRGGKSAARAAGVR